MNKVYFPQIRIVIDGIERHFSCKVASTFADAVYTFGEELRRIDAEYGDRIKPYSGRYSIYECVPGDKPVVYDYDTESHSWC